MKGENAIGKEHQGENIYVYIVGENVCETCLYPLMCSRRGPFYVTKLFSLSYLNKILNNFLLAVVGCMG